MTTPASRRPRSSTRPPGASGTISTAGGSEFESWAIYGYAYVPPTPFSRKDWDRYDVSRYVDPGADVAGRRGPVRVRAPSRKSSTGRSRTIWTAWRGATIWPGRSSFSMRPPTRRSSIWPPSGGKMIDHVPLDRHLGSIAIRRFIEIRQPLLTLHGHVHEVGRGFLGPGGSSSAGPTAFRPPTTVRSWRSSVSIPKTWSRPLGS